ncbi:MAG: histidinol-phosphatase HisJ family protein [Lachnospiraceae bacterium]|nr:histidinol-phosphatase HisJ family protein [Lachnospiraceae bacterium]
MIFSDQHMHSNFSGDSKAEMSDMIVSALNKGLKTICFTDHYDPLFPCYLPDEGRLFDLDTKRYNENAVKIRNDEKLQGKINVRIGMELGIYPKVYEMCKEIAKEYPYDFIILSSHTAGGLDPYLPSYWENIDPVDGIRKYYEEILQNLQNFDDFDIYGHLDYCVRYTNATMEQRSINNYKEIFREIFRILINKNKGIEINSCGLRRGNLKEFNPNPEIIKFYKECGGEIITFGSDAHKPEDIAYGINEACEVLKNIGFEYIADFKERKISFTKI